MHRPNIVARAKYLWYMLDIRISKQLKVLRTWIVQLRKLQASI
jgi:hypothetical protein